MSCLVEERTDKTENLHEYSLNNVLFHLEEADLSLADRDLKAEAGVLFVRLFAEEHAIASLFWGDKPSPDLDWSEVTVSSLVKQAWTTPSDWADWFLCDAGLNVASKLLKDSAVSENIAKEPLAIKFKETENDRHLVLFENVAKEGGRAHLQRGGK